MWYSLYTEPGGPGAFLSARWEGRGPEQLLRGCLSLEGCRRWKKRFHYSSLKSTLHVPINAKGQMNSVSVERTPRKEAVIFLRLNWKSSKSLAWLESDGHFWFTGLLLSKCAAGVTGVATSRQSQSYWLESAWAALCMDLWHCFETFIHLLLGRSGKH